MGKITPTLKIIGFEVRRSDASFITKQVQTEIFKIILKGGKKKGITEYIEQVKHDIKVGIYDLEQIGIPKGIGKHIEDYKKQVPPQIKGIKYSEKYLGIKFPPRSKVKFIYVEMMPAPYPPTEVLSFLRKEQVPEHVKIDWKRQMPVLIDNQVQRILEALALVGTNASIEGW